MNEFRSIKFPSQGSMFDYYIDPETKKFLPWTDKVPSFELDPDIPLQVAPGCKGCVGCVQDGEGVQGCVCV